MFEEIMCKSITTHSCCISYMLTSASVACDKHFDAWSTTRHSPRSLRKLMRDFIRTPSTFFNNTEEYDVPEQQMVTEDVGLEQDEEQKDDNHEMGMIFNSYDRLRLTSSSLTH
jgi:hypothetical protein